MKREIGIFMLALAVVGGCAAKSNTCVPGQSSACVCSDGAPGAQVCGGDSTFGACSCAVGGSNGGRDMAVAGNVGGNGSGDMSSATSSGSKRLFVTSTSYAG